MSLDPSSLVKVPEGHFRHEPCRAWFWKYPRGHMVQDFCFSPAKVPAGQCTKMKRIIKVES